MTSPDSLRQTMENVIFAEDAAPVAVISEGIRGLTYTVAERLIAEAIGNLHAQEDASFHTAANAAGLVVYTAERIIPRMRQVNEGTESDRVGRAHDAASSQVEAANSVKAALLERKNEAARFASKLQALLDEMSPELSNKATEKLGEYSLQGQIVVDNLQEQMGAL